MEGRDLDQEARLRRFIRRLRADIVRLDPELEPVVVTIEMRQLVALHEALELHETYRRAARHLMEERPRG
jgi:hypothetical protein